MNLDLQRHEAREGGAEVARAMAKSRKRERESKESVLIVEDDPLSAKMLESVLQSIGLQTYWAADGLQAIGILDREEEVDFILLDLLLPGMSGREILRRIRNHPRAYDCPIFVVTAVDCISERIDALQAGATDYVTKPFEIQELIARISAVLRERKRYKELRNRMEEMEQALQDQEDVCTRLRAQHAKLFALHETMCTALREKLRDPLERIQSSLELLQSSGGGVVEPKPAGVLAEIRRNLESLLETLGNLAAMSRIEESKDRLEQGIINAT